MSRSHPVESDTERLWRCDETSGNLIDVIAEHIGTEVGTVPAQTGLIDGARGAFSAANHFTAPAPVATLSPQRFTLSTWVYIASATQPTNSHIAAIDYDATTGGVALANYGNTSAAYVLFVHMTDGSRAECFGDALAPGWHLVTGEWDGDTARLRVDGDLIDSDASKSGKTVRYDSYGVSIGTRKRYPAQYLDGWIDELCIASSAKGAAWHWKIYSGLALPEVPQFAEAVLHWKSTADVGDAVFSSITINGVEVASDGEVTASGYSGYATANGEGGYDFYLVGPEGLTRWEVVLDNGQAVTFTGTVYAPEPAQKREDPLADLDLRIVDNDIAFDGEDLDMVAGVELVAQRVIIGLKTYAGEWFADETAGTRWFQDVFTDQPRSTIIEAMLRKQILDDEDIESLTSFSMVIDARARSVTVDFSARSTYGHIEADTLLP